MTVNEMIAKLTRIAELGGGDFPVKVWEVKDHKETKTPVDMVAGSFIEAGLKENETLIFLEK